MLRLRGVLAAAAIFGIVGSASAAPVLVGSWSGNGTAADSSAFANNGSFTGSYAAGPTPGTQAFNLATGPVTIPNIGAYALGNDYTISFSFNGDADPDQLHFIGQSAGFGYQPKWQVNYDRNLRHFILHTHDATNPGTIYDVTSSTLASNPTGWNDFQLINHNGNYTFLYNGVNIGSSFLNTPGIGLINAPLMFGFTEPGSDFLGLLANVQISVESAAVPVPEPATILLFGGPLALLLLVMRRRGSEGSLRASAC